MIAIEKPSQMGTQKSCRLKRITSLIGLICKESVSLQSRINMYFLTKSQGENLVFSKEKSGKTNANLGKVREKLIKICV